MEISNYSNRKFMNTSILRKLDWPLLVEKISSYAQTQHGRNQCLEILPVLERREIEDRWALVDPIKKLYRDGYLPPIGDLPELEDIFKSSELGQILEGQDFRAILQLLDSVSQVRKFCKDFSAKCPPLRRIFAQVHDLPKLAKSIHEAIAPDGTILDEASKELSQIRKSKINLRKKIESKITELLSNSNLETYLQDRFFTIRSDRYVVPIRIDGRGRVKGSIYDTSASGQTLFIEPQVIAPMNEQLLELELSEKLEVLRILRQLSATVAQELNILQVDYEELVRLDFLCAQACFAQDSQSGPIEIVETPSINLIQSRHPLVKTPLGRTAVANDVGLDNDRHVLMISGPNAGGKTVVLKTVAMIHTMLKSGLLIPADSESKMFLFDNLFLEMGDSQNLTANLSTFSGHLQGLRPILIDSTAKDLVLLDELAVGTEPNTGSAIAQAILEKLADRGSKVIVTTHYDNLKVIATRDKRFRNGSMEFSMESLKPTYKLILDVPGQSYGLELAEQMGLPRDVIARAHELRGKTAHALDEAVNQLMHAREELQREKDQYIAKQIAAEEEKERFSLAKKEVETEKTKRAAKVGEKYSDQLSELREEFHSQITEFKKIFKDLKKNGPSEEDRQKYIDAKGLAEQKLQSFQNAISGLEFGNTLGNELPGSETSLEELSIGSRVFIIPLAEKGIVSKIARDVNDPIEVTVGAIKLRLPVEKVRILDQGSKKTIPKLSKPGTHSKKSSHTLKAVVIQTPTNTIDVRGYDSETAIEQSWNFIDKAILRGDRAIIIVHGHGTDKLKSNIRQALETRCPYKVSFKPGDEGLGGDGVTVVTIE